MKGRTLLTYSFKLEKAVSQSHTWGCAQVQGNSELELEGAGDVGQNGVGLASLVSWSPGALTNLSNLMTPGQRS